MRLVNSEWRIMNKGGSLPLAPKVAASRQRFSATPSPGLRPGPQELSLYGTIFYEELLRSQIATSRHGSLRSQSVTLKTGRGQHRKYSPYVLTEHDFKPIDFDGFKNRAGVANQLVTHCDRLRPLNSTSKLDRTINPLYPIFNTPATPLPSMRISGRYFFAHYNPLSLASSAGDNFATPPAWFFNEVVV